MIRQKNNFVAYFIILLLVLMLPLFFDVYTDHLLVMILIYSQVALSLSIIMGDMKQFSFGHHIFFGVPAFIIAILTTKLGMPVWLGFIVAITAGSLLGLAIGYVCLRNCRSFVLSIATLGLAQIVYLFAVGLTKITGGMRGIGHIPPIVLGGIRLDNPLKFYYFALFILFCFIYIINVWRNSWIGKAVKAIGQNESLAKSVGINSYKLFVVAFTFASTLASISGVFYAHYMGHVSTLNLSLSYMFAMVVMVIVGGRESIEGPIFGAILYVLVPEIFHTTMEYRLLIFATIVLFSILFMREGLFPFFVSMYKKIPYLNKRSI